MGRADDGDHFSISVLRKICRLKIIYYCAGPIFIHISDTTRKLINSKSCIGSILF